MGSSWIARSRAQLSQRRRRVEGGRLVYYHTAADDTFWDTQWDALLTADFYQRYLHGELGAVEAPFLRHLPTDGQILEAGCGTGQVVAALRARGYDCIGVDYAQQTITQVHKILPDLPISFGDVTNLVDVKDGAFAAVISLGVVEHRRDGPEPFLEEAWRLLRPGGILLMSVPWFNDLRRWRSRHGKYQEPIGSMDFYQYAFSADEFRGYLSRASFHTIAEYPYDHRTVLGEDVAIMRHIERTSILARIVYRGSNYLPHRVRAAMGHMRLFVAEKGERSEQQPLT